jgi:flagellar basal-body rod modification protein FlgD
MGTAAAIFSHALTAGQALNGTAASPMDGSTNGTNGASGTSGTGDTSSPDDTSSNSSTISANDFLTLLVTEMQNQDPTADTDPNEYINQLVQVNSLEQLIDINQTLSGDVGSTSSGSGSDKSGQVPAAPNGTAVTSPLTATSATRAGQSGSRSTRSVAPESRAISDQTTAPGVSPGNLGVPSANAAAQKVGHALDGRAHFKPVKGSPVALQ